MQTINIDRSISMIETRLHGCKCLQDVIALAKKHPDSINQFLSLAEAIETDLNTKGILEYLWN